MSIVKDFFKRPEINAPKPPPNTPQRPLEDVSAYTPTFQSLVSTGRTAGLQRKATTQKRSLIGGS